MQHNPLTATKMFQIGCCDQDQGSEGFRIETIICMSIDYFWHTNNQTINLLGKYWFKAHEEEMREMSMLLQTKLRFHFFLQQISINKNCQSRIFSPSTICTFNGLMCVLVLQPLETVLIRNIFGILMAANHNNRVVNVKTFCSPSPRQILSSAFALYLHFDSWQLFLAFNHCSYHCIPIIAFPHSRAPQKNISFIIIDNVLFKCQVS